MAADGNAIQRPFFVGDLVGDGDQIMARCLSSSCRAVSVIPIPRPLRDALRRSSISRLEDQLRCVCGARRGVLDCSAGMGALPGSKTGRLYLFHG